MPATALSARSALAWPSSSGSWNQRIVFQLFIALITGEDPVLVGCVQVHFKCLSVVSDCILLQHKFKGRQVFAALGCFAATLKCATICKHLLPRQADLNRKLSEELGLICMIMNAVSRPCLVSGQACCFCTAHAVSRCESRCNAAGDAAKMCIRGDHYVDLHAATRHCGRLGRAGWQTHRAANYKVNDSGTNRKAKDTGG